MKIAAAALAALVAASGPVPAAETETAPTAKGTFQSKDVSFGVAKSSSSGRRTAGGSTRSSST